MSTRSVPLTAADRSALARIAANERWSREPNRVGATAAARAKSPASLEYWIRKVNPNGELAHAEARKLAENAKKAHYERLALAGRRAQAAKRNAKSFTS